MLTFIFQVELRELLQFCSSQEETDTRLVLYLHHAVNLGCKNVVVWTPGTGSLVILLLVGHGFGPLLWEKVTTKHFSVFMCSKWKEMSSPSKKPEKNPKFHKCFQQLGDDWNGNGEEVEVRKEVEKFTSLIRCMGRTERCQETMLVSSFFAKW